MLNIMSALTVRRRPPAVRPRAGDPSLHLWARRMRRAHARHVRLDAFVREDSAREPAVVATGRRPPVLARCQPNAANRRRRSPPSDESMSNVPPRCESIV